MGLINNLILKSASLSAENPTKFLLYSTIVGYGISSTAEAIAAYTNKNIEKAERTYIALQDLLEGVFKLGTFFLIAKSLSNHGKNLVDVGKITIGGKQPAYLKESMGVFGLLVGNVISFNILTPLIRNPIAAYIQKKYFPKKECDCKNNTEKKFDYTTNFNDQKILPATTLTGFQTKPFQNFEQQVNNYSLSRQSVLRLN